LTGYRPWEVLVRVLCQKIMDKIDAYVDGTTSATVKRPDMETASPKAGRLTVVRSWLRAKGRLSLPE
jgi:hypothetical protein